MTRQQAAPRHTNRLVSEPSPYPLQHAHNPVDWYPWGEEALRRAREENRPILLSIGYSACHWCHVMERESFEDEGIAALMNQHFVCIKVDREERPDLDEIYMAATLALNGGQGGWPMTVFLTPDQKPFFAGTYFPPTDRYGRPGFTTLLKQIAESWPRNRAALEAQAGQVSDHLREQVRPAAPIAVGAPALDAAAAQFARDFDSTHGGFGSAPKFPPATGLSFLLRRHRRSGDAHDLRMAETTLNAMARGGMIAQYPRAFAKSLAVVDFLLEGPVELALVGQPGQTGFEALRRAIARHYLPNRIIAHHDPTAGDPPAFPLLAGKGLVRGKAALYVCRNFACQAPITDPTEVAAVLAAVPKDLVVDTRTLSGTRRPGHATAAGTAAYAARFVAAFGAGAYAQLGSTGRTVSRVGFGGYRVDDQTPEHREALKKALVSGANLIDTSTNYTGGGSERLVGAVVNELVGSEQLRREEIVVVSKLGYVQGSNLSLAQEREAAGRPLPEMVKYMDGCWHCLHPEFLQDQLDRSLARLGLQTLDVCLLHNPEYFFSDAKRRGLGPLAALRDEFYRRLMEAFRFFEGQVAAGTIRWYGVSSNTATAPAADPEATSLTRMLLAAREVGGADHHFRVLQLPMNLFEASGVLEHNNGPENRETVLECASREGIGVLVNRPLNAIVGEGMLRLADVPVGPGAVRFDAQRKVLAELEAEYRGQIAPNIRVSPGSGSPEEFFRWAEQLDGVQARLQSLEYWQQIEGQMIVPSVTQVVRALDGGLGGEVAERWRTWRDRYLPELRLLLVELRRQAAQKSQALTRAVAAAVDPLLPTERSGETLSRKALWVVASTPGVGSVLNGMRTPAYVDDTLGILRWPRLASILPVYEVIRGLQLPRR